ERRLLCRESYERIGGVAGALAEHADGIIESLPPAQVRVARGLLLRLITPEGTRRVLAMAAALQGLEAGAEETLRRLVQARLLTIRRGGGGGHETAIVELVHESLVKSWNRLARWIEESREEISFLAEVGQAAELWEKRGKRQDEAWQGEALHEARRSLKKCSAVAPALVVEFVEAGRRREQRRRRNKRWAALALVGISTTIAVVAIAVAHRMAVQRRTEERQRAEAQREGARAAFANGRLLEVRAKLRGSLETQDSLLARALWWQVHRDPLVWSKDLGTVVYSLAFSPDGRCVAVSSQNRVIYLVDVDTMATRALRDHDGKAKTIAFSPDGSYLAAGFDEGSVGIWDLDGGGVSVVRGQEQAQNEVAFSPDGETLASASGDGTICLWEVASRQVRRKLVVDKGGFAGIAFTPDGRHLFSSGSDGTIRTWEIATGAMQVFGAQHQGPVWPVAMSPDGSLVASGGADSIVRLWERGSGKQQHALLGHRGAIARLAFHPSGRVLASSSFDATIRLWDAGTGGELGELTGHGSLPRGLAFDRSGRSLASAGIDMTVKLWDPAPFLQVAGGNQIIDPGDDRLGNPPGHGSSCTCLSFSPDSMLVATGGIDRAVRIWDVRTGRQIRRLLGHASAVNDIAHSPDGRLIASAGSDKSVRLWDATSGAELRLLTGHGYEVTQVGFSRDGTTVISAAKERVTRLWAASSGAQVGTVQNSFGAGMGSSADGTLMLSVGQDGMVRLWDAVDWREKAILAKDASPFGGDLSSDGRYAAYSSRDSQVHVIDNATGKTKTFGEGRFVYYPSFHPDSKRLLMASSLGPCLLCNVETEQCVLLKGHHGLANRVRFSHDGTLFGSTSEDQTVRIWYTDSGKPYWRGPLLTA
ncbi:MAG: WD40 repeat domain-containing protein, partial [Pseudomonadota bacterium]